MNSKSDSAPKTWADFPGDLQESIRRRAEEIYDRGGRIPGHDIANWMQAEQEILCEAAKGNISSHASNAVRRAVVVEANGQRYVGEYSPETCDGYIPGEFVAGDPIPVRFEGNKMFVTRSNGKELETTLVKKTG